jgi:hypothetical protein
MYQFFFLPNGQQGEDVVVMAQALEKLLKGKLLTMPKDEIAIDNNKEKKAVKQPKPKGPAGTFVGGVSTPQLPTAAKPSTNIPSNSDSSNSSSNAQVTVPTIISAESGGTTIPGSTNKPTTANANVQQNIHNLIMPPQQQQPPQQPPLQPPPPPQQNASMPAASATSSSFLVNPPMLNSVMSQQPAKVKKGVKRKADTTTPIGFNDSSYAPADAKVSTRGRQVSFAVDP